MGSSKKGSAKVYDYRYALDYALCQGPVDSINYVWIKDKRAFCGSVTRRRDLCIHNDDLFGGDEMEGGIDGVIECYMGEDDQSASVHLARRMGFDNTDDPTSKKHWTKAPGLPGIVHMFFRKSGSSRGGFRWGTNNPYLPGMQASVTYIPRQLSSKYALIRPLTAVYKEGQVPDQQDPDTYGTGVVYASGDEASYHQGPEIEKRVWNNGSIWSYWPEYWYKQGPYVQVVNIEDVGICDKGYEEKGINLSSKYTLLDSNGKPLVVGSVPAEGVETGKAYFEIEMAATIDGIGLIGASTLGVAHSFVMQQYAATSDGLPGAELGLLWGTFVGERYKTKEPVHPKCRFVKIGMSSNAQWLYNHVAVSVQSIHIRYPDAEFTHCDKEATLTELPDANPAHIIYELLLDSEERDNENMAQYIDGESNGSFMGVAKTLFNEGFGVSIRQDESLDRKALIKTLCEHIRGAVFQHPVSGLWTLKLFRADYDVSKLEIITDLDCKIKTGQRRAYAQCLSEITVEYTHPNEEITASVTAHNDTAAAITGNRVPEVRSYQFIRNEALAQIVADRDVAEAAYPLWNGTLLMSRKNWKRCPGDVFILNYQDDDFQIANMVVRVLNVDHASMSDRTISVEVVEDIFAVARTEYRSPQPVITDSSVATKPKRLSAPQYMIPMSLPFPLVERLGLLDNIEDEEDHYRIVLFGSIDYQLDSVMIYQRNYVDNTQTELKNVSVTTCARMTDAFNISVYSYMNLTTVEQVCPEGALPGTLLLISPDIESTSTKWSVNIEAQTEIVELVSYDPNLMQWKIKRGVFDTVPRQWDTGALVWNLTENLEYAQLFQEVPDPNETPYPFWCKCVAGNYMTSDAAMFKLPVNEVLRNQIPHRPGNVKVNGIGPDPLIDVNLNTTITDLVITWSSRNGQGEEATVPAWSDSDYATTGVTYTVRFRDPEDAAKVRFEQTGISDKTVTIPVANTAPRGVVLVEVWAVDSTGKESLMASQNYVQIDKVALDYQGWNYQFGRNWNGLGIE